MRHEALECVCMIACGRHITSDVYDDIVSRRPQDVCFYCVLLHALEFHGSHS